MQGGVWPDERRIVDADSFMGRLQKRTNLRFDLPTEAQWEYACRAGTDTALNSRKNLSDSEKDANVAEVGRYLHNGGEGGKDNRDCGTANGTNAVGSYKANEWGLYDCHGNVCEWCLDWYDNYSPDAVTDPQGASSGSLRVLRGGGWDYDAQRCRSAGRNSYFPSDGYSGYGFRVAFRP